MRKVTAIAGSNIAFVKYWGNRNNELNLPLNGNISMTLDAATSITTIDFSLDYERDTVTLNDTLLKNVPYPRVGRILDYLRNLTGIKFRARIASSNNFPTGAGIASSASGSAALTYAACKALELDLNEAELSRIARLGSGSACRSILGGFVEWLPGGRHEDSFAVQIAPPEHWNLIDMVAIVSTKHKEVSSSKGHPTAKSSFFMQARQANLQKTLPLIKTAIYTQDLQLLGEMLEEETISMHAVMMTSIPNLFYWESATLTLIQKVREWRKYGLPVYYTIDAGPNLHLITEEEYLDKLIDKLKSVSGVKQTIVCRPGTAARVTEKHLF